MAVLDQLKKRSDACELCGSRENLMLRLVPPHQEEDIEHSVLSCTTCQDSIESPADQPDHWRCLGDAMWSEHTPVKVQSAILLNKLNAEDWARDLKEMLYLTDEEAAWVETASDIQSVIHKDANGHVLQAGDSVVLIQDLKVKGGGFTAKRGTAVRRIRLVPDNAEHIEGKVEGQQILILTKYVKKTS